MSTFSYASSVDCASAYARARLRSSVPHVSGTFHSISPCGSVDCGKPKRMLVPVGSTKPRCAILLARAVMYSRAAAPVSIELPRQRGDVDHVLPLPGFGSVCLFHG